MSKGLSFDGLSKVLALLGGVVPGVMTAVQAWQLGRELFEGAVKSGQDPTDEELRANMERIKGRSDRIQNA